MKESERKFREDTRAMQRLAWVLWTMAEPAPSPGEGARRESMGFERFASVKQLREAVQLVWRESGRRIVNGGPGLQGLAATVNGAMLHDRASSRGRTRWIQNHYTTQEQQRNNYQAGDYYRLAYQPAEIPPLDLATGPDVLPFVDVTENGQDDNHAHDPIVINGDTMDTPPPTPEKPDGWPLSTPRGADVVLMAQQLRNYDHLARQELTAAACELASAMDRTGLTFTVDENHQE